MNFDHSASSSSKTNATKPAKTPPAVPRLASLQHRLQHAKDTDGRPIPLVNELLFFLDDPPPGTRDRWQEGADLCQKHGISTSRMSVWRFYHAHFRTHRNLSPRTFPYHHIAEHPYAPSPL